MESYQHRRTGTSPYNPLCQILAGCSDSVDWPAYLPVDWELLVHAAQVHGVAPLLYHALREAGWPEQMPSRLRNDLQAAYHKTTAQNMLLYQELSRILTAVQGSLAPGQIPVVVLKGAALAATIYPSIGLRPMGDLDLLVPKHLLDDAVEAVKGLGYSPEARPEIRPGLARLTGYEVNLDGGRHLPLHVELHWNLIGGQESHYQPDIDWFWKQIEPWKMESGKWRTESSFHFPPSTFQLTPSAHLLDLGANLALKNGEAHEYLRWFYDIHRLVPREGHRIDWDELVLRAEEFRWAAALHSALQGVQDRFATQLPGGVLDALAEAQDPQAARSVARRAGPVQTRAVRTWDSLTSQSWSARLRLAWAIACPSPAFMRWRYNPRPTWLWPLWYPYRWFDILRDGLSTVWRIVRRSQSAEGRGSRRDLEIEA